MRKLSLREIQYKELNVLKKIDLFCEKHNITYFLAYGSLLGAVRHKGFIPWDDDIDIMMPRPDYNKFLSLRDDFCKENLNMGINTLGNKNYNYAYTKVFDKNTIVVEKKIRKCFKANIWVDVFPLDGVYADDKKNKKVFFLSKIYSKISASARIRFGAMSGNFIIKLIGSLFIPAGMLLNKLFKFKFYIEKLAVKNDYNTSVYVGDILGTWISSIVKKKSLYPVLKMSFEDCEFNIPSNYDIYLTQLYGNYMQLPPIEKRISHNLDAWEI